MTTHSSDSTSGSRDSETRESAQAESGPGGSGRAHRAGRRTRHRGHRARKERVLHTRISEQLAEDIREFAEDLRVPASNLVRNVLEEVFTVVSTVSGDVGGLMDDLIDEAEGVRDRVRRQARSGRSREFRRSAGRPSSRSRRDHADVEDELRRDEEREATTRSGADRAQADRPKAPAGDEPATAAELFPDILGWQPLVLNRDFDCGRCGRELPAGESAFLGLGAGGVSEVALCGRCASARGAGRG